MSPHKAWAEVDVPGTGDQGGSTQSYAGTIPFSPVRRSKSPMSAATVGGHPVPRLCRLPAAIRLCAVAAFLVMALPTPADSQQSSPTGWPAISAEELARKDDPTNPGASAILLYREQHTDDVKQFETNYSRIKVLTDEGKKYADIEIPYFDKAVRIEDVRARTVQPDGKAVDFDGQIFDKLVAKAKGVKFQAKTFTLPDVRAGSIIEYSYSMRWREKPTDVLKHPEHYIITFSAAIPTARWVIPNELFTRRARFSIRPLPNAQLIWASKGLPKDSQPTRQPDGTVQLDVQNLPGFREEEFMPPAEALKARVDFFYVLGFLGNDESFWAEQARREAGDLEKFIGDYKSVRRAADQAVDANDQPETKLRKLYARAQQVRYLSYEPLKTEQEERRENLKTNKNVDDILKHGYGSGNEVNLLFVALARAAGFQSAPVMVADRRHYFFDRSRPDLRQLDAMVVWVRAGAKDYYYDPASRYCSFGSLPWFETNTLGIRVSKVGGGLVTIPPGKSADAVIERKATLELDADGNLQGKLSVNFVGQEALERRSEARETDEAGRRKELEDEVKGWLPPGTTVELKSASNWEQSGDALYAEFTLKVPNYASSTGRRLLARSGIFQANTKRFFQNARRVHPVYFPYPYQEVDDITLQLGSSGKVESLPAPRSQTVSFGSYEASCASQGGTVQLKRKMTMDGIYFTVDYYAALKAFYNTVRAGDEQQIVLQNVSAAQNNRPN
jgi:hypothetical protein